MSVAFTNTTTGSVTTWAWNFGDGTTSNLQSPTHVYSKPGSYTSSLPQPAPVAQRARRPLPRCVASVAPPASGLVAAYAFNEGAGTSGDRCFGQQATPGALNGATWTTQGRFGGALTFNGVSNLVLHPQLGLAQRVATAMTLEAWVNPIDGCPKRLARRRC